MDSSCSLRRSTRGAARQAATKLQAAACEQSPASEPPKQQRKRQRASQAAGPLHQEVAVEDGAPLAAQGPSKAPAKKGKAAAAAAGPSREFEQELWAQGYATVAGVDEAGRGPLAGPVVAAACIIPPHVHISGIEDSKKLSAEQREQIYLELTTQADIRWATQVIDAGEIDQINILQAAMKAMEGATAGLGEGAADYVLVDGNRLPKAFDPQRSRAIVKGDSKCYAIAAASIIAKVTRDRLMDGYHQQYPQWNFGKHKGYCVPEHVEAIRRHGPCAIHRRTFAPIKHWFPLEAAVGAGEEREAGAGEEKQQGGEGKAKGAGRRKRGLGAK